MRRSLVLTNETARNPFRASLPPHVCQLQADDLEPRIPWRMRLGRMQLDLGADLDFGADDVRSFLASYCACLIAVSLFIA